MKLVFKKNEATDVEVTMFIGTAEVPFSYIEMIKALLAGEPLDSDFDDSIAPEEQILIKEVLDEIVAAAKENDAEEPESEDETEPDEIEDDTELPF